MSQNFFYGMVPDSSLKFSFSQATMSHFYPCCLVSFCVASTLQTLSFIKLLRIEIVNFAFGCGRKLTDFVILFFKKVGEPSKALCLIFLSRRINNYTEILNSEIFKSSHL